MGAAKSAADSGASLIAVLTETGTTARLIAKYRPKATIVAFTGRERTARSLTALRGVKTVVINTDGDIEEVALKAIDQLKSVCPAVKPGASVVLVTEHRAGEKGASINHKAIKLVTV